MCNYKIRSAKASPKLSFRYSFFNYYFLIMLLCRSEPIKSPQTVSTVMEWIQTFHASSYCNRGFEDSEMFLRGICRKYWLVWVPVEKAEKIIISKQRPPSSHANILFLENKARGKANSYSIYKWCQCYQENVFWIMSQMVIS